MITHTHTEAKTQCPAAQKSCEFWEILKLCSDIYENTEGPKFIVLFGTNCLIKSGQFA